MIQVEIYLYHQHLWMELVYANKNLVSIKDIPDNGKDHLITTLNISINNLTSLRGIERYPNIRTLYCYSNQLTTLRTRRVRVGFAHLQELEACTNLKILHCYNNQLTSLRGLEVCPNLMILRCYRNQLITLRGLEDCTKLEILECGDNLLTSLRGLEACTNLSSLFCSSNQLTTLQGLEACTNLLTLDCDNNRLTSLRELKACSKLEILECGDNLLTSLQGLEACTNLRILHCYNNRLTSLHGLQRRPFSIIYDTDHFHEEYNPKMHLRILNLLHLTRLVRRAYLPVLEKRISKFQKIWQEYYYSPTVKYQGVEINRLCFSDYS